jgi:hypothetical protein
MGIGGIEVEPHRLKMAAHDLEKQSNILIGQRTAPCPHGPHRPSHANGSPPAVKHQRSPEPAGRPRPHSPTALANLGNGSSARFSLPDRGSPLDRSPQHPDPSRRDRCPEPERQTPERPERRHPRRAAVNRAQTPAYPNPAQNPAPQRAPGASARESPAAEKKTLRRMYEFPKCSQGRSVHSVHIRTMQASESSLFRGRSTT